jgi:hypothetical protein
LDINDAKTNETRVPLPPPSRLNLSATVPASADTVKAATAEPVLQRDVVVVAAAEVEYLGLVRRERREHD